MNLNVRGLKPTAYKRTYFDNLRIRNTNDCHSSPNEHINHKDIQIKINGKLGN